MLPTCGRAGKSPQKVLQNRMSLQLAGRPPWVRRKRGGEPTGLRAQAGRLLRAISCQLVLGTIHRCGGSPVCMNRWSEANLGWSAAWVLLGGSECGKPRWLGLEKEAG